MARRNRSKKPDYPYSLDVNSPQAQGLVGWWPGGPSGGQKLYDLSGYGNNGALTNFGYTPASGWAPGVDGGNGALRYDASNDYVQTAFASQLTDFTVSCWFFAFSGPGGSYYRIVDKAFDTGFWLGHGGGSGTTAWGGGIMQTSGAFMTPVTLALNQWHLLTMRRSGTTQTVFGDGGKVTATATVSGSALSSTQMRFGTSVTPGAGDYFDGISEDIRIYNRARSDAEIAADYDPSTRWNLRWTPSRVAYSFGSGGAVVTPAGAMFFGAI